MKYGQYVRILLVFTFYEKDLRTILHSINNF